MNRWEWLSNFIPLDHKAYIAGAESTETPDPDDEWSIQTTCMPQAHNTLAHHMWTLKLLCNIWNQEVMCIVMDNYGF